MAEEWATLPADVQYTDGGGLGGRSTIYSIGQTMTERCARSF